MSSEKSDPEAYPKNRLPFEPAKSKRKKSPKSNPAERLAGQKIENRQPDPAASTAIPAVVSQRMVRRIAFWCGVPTALGMLTFIVSYLIISHHWFKVPNVAVLLASLGFFGLGVLGLSYGVISASWDEEIPGSILGWKEFTTNFGRLTAAWRSRSKLKTEE